VWKKGCIKSRNNVFGKLTVLLAEMNEIMAIQSRAVFAFRQEYTIEHVEYILSTFLDAVGMTEADFVHGRGKRKTPYQRLYEKVKDCCKKLKEYAYKISVCGEERNSYSKTELPQFVRTAQTGAVHRGIEGVILELGLISCGFNLHKYHLKKIAAQKAA